MAVVWPGPLIAADPPSVSSAPAKLTIPPLPPAHRDPALPPLTEQAAWREGLLSVRLNGQAVSLGGLFVEAPDGRLAAQLALLDAWRIRTDAARVLTFQGAPYYPLDAIPGISIGGSAFVASGGGSLSTIMLKICSRVSAGTATNANTRMAMLCTAALTAKALND